jgi:hypothetical protein
MLTVVIVLKALAEIALLALVGQGLLFVLSGAAIRGNVFYGVLATLTSPARRVAAWMTPASMARFHGFVAFCMLLAAWLALTLGKIRLVLQHAGG